MTRLFGVIGDPISHSLSPVLHGAALRAMRLDALYAPFEVPRRDLAAMLRGLILAGVEGLNVTVPLKEAVMPLMDRLDQSAKEAGAVNTILIRRRRTIGYNTDGAGFLLALRELGWSPRPLGASGHHQGFRLGMSPKGHGSLRRSGRVLVAPPAHAVILGAGGSARAVASSLAGAAGVRLTIANRGIARAGRLARRLAGRHPSLRVRAVPLREVTLEDASLLVNATTVGMDPGDGLPVSLATLRRDALVYDLVYHRETALVRSARRAGCIAANGGSMLLYQGAEALRLWLHRAPPLDIMRRALQRALRDS